MRRPTSVIDFAAYQILLYIAGLILCCESTVAQKNTYDGAVTDAYSL